MSAFDKNEEDALELVQQMKFDLLDELDQITDLDAVELSRLTLKNTIINSIGKDVTTKVAINSRALEDDNGGIAAGDVIALLKAAQTQTKASRKSEEVDDEFIPTDVVDGEMSQGIDKPSLKEIMATPLNGEGEDS